MQKLTHLFQEACWCKILVSETRQSLHSRIMDNSGCAEKLQNGTYASVLEKLLGLQVMVVVDDQVFPFASLS